MSVLCLWLCLWFLFFAGFGLSSGEARTNATNIRVYGVLGGSALLQINDSKWEQCTEKCSLEWMKADLLVHKLTKQANDTSCRNVTNCTILINGNLLLSNITTTDAGNYTTEMYSNGALKYNQYFQLEIQDHVSVPEVSYTCLPNASVQLSCRAQNGTDPSYSWSVDGPPSWSPAGGKRTAYQSVLENVTCSVRNRVSEERSQPTDITCPDAVSEPVVNYTCLSNGSVQLSCQVENGTGPSYSWSWMGLDGTQQNISNSSGQITVHQTVLINVTCTATNQISEKESETRNVTCQPDTSTIVPTGVFTSAANPDTNSTENSTLHCDTSGCHHRCLLRSVTVGTVIVIVTTLPLIIGCLYTMPREKRQ